MKITQPMIEILNRYASEEKRVVVRGINYAGQPFNVRGVVVKEANTWLGEGNINDENGFGLYFGQPKHGLYGDIFVQLRSEPEPDMLGSLYIEDVQDSDGNIILRNSNFEEIKEMVDKQLQHFEGYNSTYFSREAKNLLNHIGKPVVVYGDDCILQAVREFQTPRGNVIYVDCMVGMGCRNIDAGFNANGIRFNERRYHEFARIPSSAGEMN